MARRSNVVRKTAFMSGCFGVVFGGIFVLVGGGLFIGMTALPTLFWWQSQGWTPTDCTIVKSEVVDNGDTYGVDIQYEYFVQNQSYTGDFYNFVTGTSSGRETKQAIVDRYPVGSRAQCYVNPDDSTHAVLTLEWSNAYYVGCLGLIFVVAGLGVIYGMSNVSAGLSRRGMRIRGGNTGHVTLSTGSYLPEHSDAPALLKSTVNPMVTLVGAGIFTLIWYGIIGTMTWNVASEGVSGENLIPMFFLSLMLLLGLLGVAGVIKGLLSLRNPRVRLGIAPGVLRLGQVVAIKWELDGDPSRLTTLRLLLKGTEKATYRRGTTTSTDTKVFEKMLIAETTANADMRAGQIEFAMPEFAMHSLQLPNNKIEWAIRVEGSIPKWPDLEEEFPVTVLPMAMVGSPAPVQEVEHA